MIDFLFTALDLIINASMWATIIGAIGLIAYKGFMITKRKGRSKDYFLIVASFAYLGSIIYFGLEDFQFFFSVIFMMFAVIATQLQKYEDRKGGKRWWEQ